MPTIAIIGAGFTGSMAAIHLLRHSGLHPHVILIERRRRFGRGFAYSTDNLCHLLNVPAGKMSAFAGEPSHFLDWVNSPAAKASRHYDAASFVPRRLYGDYLSSLLEVADETNPADFERIRGQVIDIDPKADGVEIKLNGGAVVRADLAVLASGNFPPLPPLDNTSELAATGHYIRDPWEPGAIERIPPDDTVVLIGAGLTMVDIVLALMRGGHRGALDAISRHGLRPRRHMPSSASSTSPFKLDEMPLSARRMLRLIRRRIREGSSENWQGVVDALRPITQELWRRAPIIERKRFLRHLQARWDVHRHRLAPEVADQIDDAIAAGRLRFHAGRLIECTEQDGEILLKMRPRGKNEIVTFTAGYVVNCTGPASDYERINDELVRNLLARGIARPDPLHLGLEVDNRLRLIDVHGRPSDRVYAAGPVTKGEAWEITAVPDLRVQAAALADYLATAQYTRR
jgi:uncharacterized NAD(P)/FAD-binding protein YdhS